MPFKIISRFSRLLVTTCGLCLLIQSQVQCQKARTASIEAIETDPYRKLPFTLSRMEGRRDGGVVTATVEFEGAGRLQLQLQIDLGPPILLSGGQYTLLREGRKDTGSIEAATLDFQAGQSGGMSLGGRFFLLGSRGAKLYRVTLPTTKIEAVYR